MLIRLYSGPMILIFVAVFIALFLGYYIPSQFSDSLIFSKLADKASSVAPVVFIGILSLGILWAFFQTFILCRWYQGKSEACYNCGGPIKQKIGRYGAYFQCYGCGKRRKV